MMKRFVALVGFCVVMLVAGVVGQTVAAQAEPPMTEEKIEHIRQNCVSAQASLNQLHASDALLRVNQGLRYQLISDKLMAPLNSRITLNRLGGLEMSATTLEYDRQFRIFSNDYQDYEETMWRMLQTKCTNQPVTFYDQLKSTREKRQKVHADTVELNRLLALYKTQFEDFAKEFQKETPQ